MSAIRLNGGTARRVPAAAGVPQPAAGVAPGSGHSGALRGHGPGFPAEAPEFSKAISAILGIESRRHEVERLPAGPSRTALRELMASAARSARQEITADPALALTAQANASALTALQLLS